MKKSYLKIILHNYSKNFLNKIGLAVVIVVLLTALLAPLLANNKPYYYSENGKTIYPVFEDVFPLHYFFDYPEYKNFDFRKKNRDPDISMLLPPISYSATESDLDQTLVPPNFSHYLGTDEQGRDIASRMIHGARVSLKVGVVAVAIYVILGILIGAIAGYFGGKIDLLISRFIEVVMCFPTFFLILAIMATVEQSLMNIMLVIGLTGWTGIARIIRGEFFKFKELDFVQSAKALGYSAPRIIFRHILPNALTPVLVMVTFGMASAILIESSLSFLGFGVEPPTPSWGDILSQSRDFMDIAWWLVFYPGMAIFVTVTSFNLVGEGMQEAINPRGNL